MAQLLAFPIGRAWARLMPQVKVFGISLNPGPFNVKEHVLITVMATVGYQSAYAVSCFAIFTHCVDIHGICSQTDIIAVQRVYYNQIYNFSYQWMVVMSTQLVCHNRTSYIEIVSHIMYLDRFLDRRSCSPILGVTSINDLAHQSGHLCPLQHTP